MIQPAGNTTSATYAVPSSTQRENAAASVLEPSSQKDSIEISLEYYSQKNPNNRYTILPTEEDLKMGGVWMKDKNGNAYFQVAKKEYQEKGIQGMKESLVPGDMNARMSEEVLNALEFLPGEKRELAALIESAASKAGLSKGDIKKLKIEVDAKGSIVVGGLRDKAMLKKVQEALNNVSGLAGRIENFQFVEETMYRRVKSLNITPFKLDENGGPAITGMDYLADLASQTDDIESIEGLDHTLAYACLEYFKDPIETADFSHKASGVVNPKGDMEKKLSEYKTSITNSFHDYNRERGFAADDPDRINWNNVKIRITESGGIEFDGRFSKSEETNSYAEFFVREKLQALMMTEEDGTEGLFTTALQRITILHDEEYGDGDDMGIQKEAVFEFSLSSGATNAYVMDRSGNAEKQTHDVIKKEVAGFINQNDPEAKVDSKSIAITEDGRITYTGAPNSTTSSIIDQLNFAIGMTQRGRASNPESPINQLANTVLKKFESLKAYGPEGSSKYLHYKSANEEEEEYVEKYQSWSKAQPYTYSKYDQSKDPLGHLMRYAKPMPSFM